MPSGKVILLVEANVKAEHRDAVFTAAAEGLGFALAEDGIDIFYQTRREDDPNALVFFEVYASVEAYESHMQKEHTKKFFQEIEGKLLSPPAMTRLVELS